jgi:hypothetical protein
MLEDFFLTTEVALWNGEENGGCAGFHQRRLEGGITSKIGSGGISSSTIAVLLISIIVYNNFSITSPL